MRSPRPRIQTPRPLAFLWLVLALRLRGRRFTFTPIRYQRIRSENSQSWMCLLITQITEHLGTPNTEVGSVCKKHARKSLCFQVVYSKQREKISENNENIVMKKAQHCLTEYYFISFPFLICNLQDSLIHSSVHLSIYSSVHPSIHSSVHPSIHLSISPSIHHSSLH